MEYVRLILRFLIASCGCLKRRALYFALGGALLLGGCIPYTVGTTAQPVEEGELRPYSALTFIPSGSSYGGVDEDEEDTAGYALPSTGARLGLDGASDLGLRAPGAGFVLDYKRRVLGDSLGRSPAVALMGGAGIINGGNNAHFEASLLVSGPEQGRTLTPYGGVRVMHALPLSDIAVSDQPTVGGLVGLRIGTSKLGVSPEVGVFYDPSALELRDHDVIVVPAVTLHGRGLLGIFDL